MNAEQKESDPYKSPYFILFSGSIIESILYHLYSKLLKKEFKPSFINLALTTSLFCWFPYAVASFILDPRFATENRVIALLPTHIRFLVALPILFIGQRVVNQRVAESVKHILTSHILTEDERVQAWSAVNQAIKVQKSGFLDLISILVVFTLLILSFMRDQKIGKVFQFQDFWITCIGLPIFQMMIMKWVTRIWIWTKLLWVFSRIRIRLIPLHPDGKGGLGFLNHAQKAFVWITMAFASVLVSDLWSRLEPNFKISWDIYNPVLYDIFKIMSVYLLANLAIFLGPLLLFSPQLYRVRSPGVMAYTEFADQCVQAFGKKWFNFSSPDQEVRNEVLTSDVSVLADLITSFSHTKRMAIFVPDRVIVLSFALASIVPVIPFILSQIPITILIAIAKKLFL